MLVLIGLSFFLQSVGGQVFLLSIALVYIPSSLIFLIKIELLPIRNCLESYSTFDGDMECFTGRDPLRRVCSVEVSAKNRGAGILAIILYFIRRVSGMTRPIEVASFITHGKKLIKPRTYLQKTQSLR